MLFVSVLEFLVRFFKFGDFCRQLHISIIMLVQRICSVWIALCALPCEGLFQSPVLLLVTALHGVMGVVDGL